MTRIEKKFKDLRLTKKKAFVVFLTCGYPNMRITERLISKLSQIGVDVIELGVPFSDPLADGPTIQEASSRALKNKINLNSVLGLVKKIRKRKITTPICIMTYYNPIFCFDEGRFIRMARQSGVDGIIIPDLPPEEGQGLIRLARRVNLDTIFFLSPTSNLARIRYISRVSRGFIYYVSLTGVTGERANLPKDLIKNLTTIKRATRLPVCVGFGVSSPQQVKQIYRFADGVIVGSAIINRIKKNLNHPDLINRVCSFIKFLKNV